MDKWLRFEPDRTVRLAVGKVEIGQGNVTALAQIAAEELDVDLDRIAVLSGDTQDAPDEGQTTGSQSIEVSGRSVRLVSAELRARVLDRLAQRLNCSPTELSVEDGAFLRGDAADRSRLLEFRRRPRISRATSRAPRRRSRTPRIAVVGKPVPRRDLPAKVTAPRSSTTWCGPTCCTRASCASRAAARHLASLDEAARASRRTRRFPRRARRRFRRVRRQ